jgi:type IV secretion system protein VirB4
MNAQIHTSSREAALRRERPAACRIPYTSHVTPHLVKTDAGDYVQVFRLGGASFESADDEVLNNWHERLNVLWRNIGSPNVTLWSHILRRRERALPAEPSSVDFAARLAAKYRAKLANETLMVNDLYVSLIYRPVTGAAPGLVAKLVARQASRGERASVVDASDICEKLSQTLLSSLARYEPQRLAVYRGSDRFCSSILEFFGELVNGEWQRMPLPHAPLNQVLATTRPIFGTEVIEYRLPTRTRFGAVLGIKEYATPSVVGMFDRLLSAPFEFVLTQSFAFLTKGTSQGLLQRQYNQMVNAGDFAVSQAEELKDALDALTANEFVMGDHHFTLQILSDDPTLKGLNDDIALARSILADTGLTTAREDLALEGAFWAQLPACFGLRPRKAPITSRNFSAKACFHNFPTGRATGNHWGDALALLITSARSPYYFSLHASDPTDPDGGSRKDTGHTFICGPTGSGKSVFIGFMLTMLSRQGATQVVFDKDRGLEILVRALGGTYLPLKGGTPTGFNPLRLPPTPANVEFLKIWLRSLVRGSQPLSIREENDLDHALSGVLALEPEARRLSRLIEFTDATRADGIQARLARWCESSNGPYAWVFDNPDDSLVEQLSGRALFGIDVTEFLDNAFIRSPVTLYLFHVVRALLDGRKFVCWMDEFWRLLADPAFESFAKDGPKTWRKLNAVMCLATQSASDVLDSSISRTIIEQTPTKILFPNPDANPTEYIEGFGLSEREFKLIKEQLEPGSRMFLIKQGHYSIVCELNLRGFDAELKVISGRASSLEELERVMKQVGPDPAQWLPLFTSQPSGARSERAIG